MVRKKKAQFMKANNGLLMCEACNFDFKKAYRDIGEAFCEVHHKVPLSKLEENVRTTLDDLAVLCPNCHRMIHKTNPMLSVEELRKKVVMRYSSSDIIL